MLPIKTVLVIQLSLPPFLISVPPSLWWYRHCPYIPAFESGWLHLCSISPYLFISATVSASSFPFNYLIAFFLVSSISFSCLLPPEFSSPPPNICCLVYLIANFSTFYSKTNENAQIAKQFCMLQSRFGFNSSCSLPVPINPAPLFKTRVQGRRDHKHPGRQQPKIQIFLKM